MFLIARQVLDSGRIKITPILNAFTTFKDTGYVSGINPSYMMIIITYNKYIINLFIYASFIALRI